MAQIEHFCDKCTKHIIPGDEYGGTVYAADKGIIVIKEHINPECDWPDREKYSGLEKDLVKEESIPAAA